jgi:phosphoglucosamine mutase
LSCASIKNIAGNIKISIGCAQNDSLNFNCNNKINARVSPHDGQGIPIYFLTGHSNLLLNIKMINKMKFEARTICLNKFFLCSLFIFCPSSLFFTYDITYGIIKSNGLGGSKMRKLFGTDGVRGLANTELTCELAYNLGRAGAFVLSRSNHHIPKIIVGKDTRISGYMLESALAAGMCSVGAKVYLAGVVPTPAIAYLVREYNCDAGVVISASHNPFHDNGIKFFNGDGYKLSDSLEEQIEDIIFNKQDILPHPTGENLGFITYRHNAINDYIKFLMSTLDKIDLSGLKIALDCANGATFKAAPYVFKNLGAQVFVINDKPNGKNINLNCGSTHLNQLVEFVLDNNIDVGFGFDGDGDRCLAVDSNGNIVHGDEILSICAHYMKQNGLLNHNTIVATIMSNLGLFIMGEKYGINVEKTGVGDRYVLEKMLECGYNLGGEQSGHIIFSDHNTTGDGILTALYLSKIMAQSNKKLSSLNNLMNIMPQVLVNAKVSNNKKNQYMFNTQIKSEIKMLEQKFANNGRVVIRPSGTEPLIRVMLEGSNKSMLTQEALRLAGIMEKYLN